MHGAFSRRCANVGATTPPRSSRSGGKTIREWQERHPLRFDQEPDGPLKPQYVITRLRDLADQDAIVVSGVGQHQMWASQYWGFEQPRRWINSGGLGTMGFAVPAAVGAKAGKPDQQVIAVDGDGCFQMTFQELITASVENIPIKVAVFNNAAHGMVRQWQRLFYNEPLLVVRPGTTTAGLREAGRGYGMRRAARHPGRRSR